MTIKNSETETSKNQARNLLSKNVTPSVRFKADTCRYFTNTRRVTTELMHVMSQNHRHLTLRNTTVFLFINIILKSLFTPSYMQTVIKTLNYCNILKYGGNYPNYTQIHHTASHPDQNTPQAMDIVLKYTVIQFKTINNILYVK